jgi:uncharacterized SAM-binding protein YcdF (DUF218 family)
MKILRGTILAVGILALLNFIYLFRISNIHLGHVLVLIIALDFIAYAIFFERLPRWAHITIVAFYSVPVVFALFLWTYGKFSSVDYNEDVVIVLGAGLRADDEPSRHLALRLDTAAEYLHANENAVVIVSGGLGARRRITEAEAMARYLTRRGIAPERIFQEDASTSTYENLKFSDEILRELLHESYRAVIVTNDFHIFRATHQARRLGIDATPLGAPTPWHSYSSNYLREMVAVVNYFVFGQRGNN